jgi:hypothetical protein
MARVLVTGIPPTFEISPPYLARVLGANPKGAGGPMVRRDVGWVLLVLSF